MADPDQEGAGSGSTAGSTPLSPEAVDRLKRIARKYDLVTNAGCFTFMLPAAGLACYLRLWLGWGWPATIGCGIGAWSVLQGIVMLYTHLNRTAGLKKLASRLEVDVCELYDPVRTHFPDDQKDDVLGMLDPGRFAREKAQAASRLVAEALNDAESGPEGEAVDDVPQTGTGTASPTEVAPDGSGASAATTVGGFLGLLAGFFIWRAVGGIGGLVIALIAVPIMSAVLIAILSAMFGKSSGTNVDGRPPESPES